MGGGESHVRSVAEEEEEGESLSTPQDSQRQTASESTTGEEPYPEAPAQLPQCQMGSRTVDDMRFMISCTNWY